MVFNKEYISDEGFFNNGKFEEFDTCIIYMDDDIIGKEHWTIRIEFFRGIGFPVNYCIRFYKGIYNGDDKLDSNIEVSRISVFEPTYIILPDRHYNLSNEEIIRFDNIMANNWDKLISLLNEEMKGITEFFLEQEYIPVYPKKPDYTFLQYYNLIK